MKKLFAVTVLSLTLALPMAIRAQGIPVMDIANLIQDILQALNQIEQIEHEVKSLANEAQSLEHEASNLKGLNFDVVAQLNQTTASINQLINQAQGIAFNVSDSLQAFNALYPKSHPAGTTNAQLAVDTLNRWNSSLEALKSTVQVQSQATQNFAKDQSALSDLVNQSQSAEGALQAAQVTNQLLALHARQMIQDQQLRIAQDRATSMEQARVVAAEEKARTVRSHFMTGGSHYTPEPVQLVAQ
jgi:P-type conjugative transfer protein TrbJ